MSMVLFLPDCSSQLLSAGHPDAAWPCCSKCSKGCMASETQPCLLPQTRGCPSQVHPPRDRELLGAALPCPSPGAHLGGRQRGLPLRSGAPPEKRCLSHQTRGFPTRGRPCPVDGSRGWGGSLWAGLLGEGQGGRRPAAPLILTSFVLRPVPLPSLTSFTLD